jgi:hypothetical protein
MVYTTLTSILGSTKTSNLLNEGDIRNIIVTAEISEDMAPGAFVYNNQATGKWIPLDSGTAAHKLAGPGQVGCILYRPRIFITTGAQRVNSDDYDITYTKSVPICISGIVVGNIIDLNADHSAGTGLIASSTAESLDVLAQEATGATSGSAIKSRICATLAAVAKDGDLKAVIALGACMGSIWGGINES